MDGGCQNNPNQVPEYVYPKGALLRFDIQSDLVEVYGNCYYDNLIGFDPITFNQRTEQHFDRPYSNVGVLNLVTKSPSAIDGFLQDITIRSSSHESFKYDSLSKQIAYTAGLNSGDFNLILGLSRNDRGMSYDDNDAFANHPAFT